jgi:hypothetical protein
MINVGRFKPWLGFYLLGALLISIGVSIGRPVCAAENNPAGPDGVELTVYNDDLALVKERRWLHLAGGVGSVSFTDVTARLDPTSVMFKPLETSKVRVLEQNYEYDVISDLKLLQKYLGARIKITDTKGVITAGYLMGAADNVILASRPDGGEVRVLKAAQIQAITFPELPSGLVTRPTLVWLLNNQGKAGRHLVEVSYLTGGLSWKTDYVATVNAGDDQVDLTGWVTLNNQSGGDFNHARLKLVAGDLNRVTKQGYAGNKRVMFDKMAMAAPEASFAEKSFFEYHLYTLTRPTTLKNYQIKQVELLTASAVPAQKRYIYEGAVDPKKVKVVLEVKNGKAENLGVPLPKGRIRVQKADHEGALQLIGEDQIDHTPQDEKICLNLGNAFDIKGERVKTEIKNPGRKVREESYRITLRNHKKTAVTVIVVENLSRWGEWKIIKNDRPFKKTAAGKAEFKLRIPVDGEETVNYTVRYKW